MSRLEISRDMFLSCLGPKLKSLGLVLVLNNQVLVLSWSWTLGLGNFQDKSHKTNKSQT
jgi:hypothetical protein